MVAKLEWEVDVEGTADMEGLGKGYILIVGDE
jgi:hypothetical protein